MVVVYIASNVIFSNLYVRPAQPGSVALDSRIGGALADAISANPTVKGFGAGGPRGNPVRPASPRPGEAAPRTWNRYIDVWLLQNLLLAALQAGLTGLLICAGHRARPAPATSPSSSPPSC